MQTPQRSLFFSLSLLLVLAIVSYPQASMSSDRYQTFGAQQAAAQPDVKTVPAQTFYYSQHKFTPEEMRTKITPLAVRLGATIGTSGATIEGPLHFHFNEVENNRKKKTVKFKLAFPIKGKIGNKGKMKKLRAKPFKCVYMIHEGPLDTLPDDWLDLADIAIDNGFELTGKARQIMTSVNGEDDPDAIVEIQLGIK